MRRHGLECLRGTPYRRVDRSEILARSSPFDTACSEVPVAYSVLPDSSPITAPFLLHKHTRSKGPSLPRHYPASAVPLTLSDAQMVRHPERCRSRCATPRPSRASPTDADCLPHVPCSLPRWP